MLFCVDENDFLVFGEYQIYCIPTTEEEKEFIKNSTDEYGNIKPSVYDKLRYYRDDIVDNIFQGRYDDYSRDKYIVSKIIKDEVERLRDKEEDKWTIKALPFPKPSNLCLINLFYTINNNREMLNKFIKAYSDALLKVAEGRYYTKNDGC